MRLLLSGYYHTSLVMLNVVYVILNHIIKIHCYVLNIEETLMNLS